jgi:hypothetical protein
MAAASKARQFHTQQVHFLRTLINFNDPDVPTAAGTLSRAFTPIPSGANLLRANYCASTAFNSGGACTIAVGTTVAGVDVVAAADIKTAATANVVTQAPVGKSLVAADTTYYAVLTYAGAAPTAGVVEVTLEYVPAL